MLTKWPLSALFLIGIILMIVDDGSKADYNYFMYSLVVKSIMHRNQTIYINSFYVLHVQPESMM